MKKKSAASANAENAKALNNAVANLSELELLQRDIQLIQFHYRKGLYPSGTVINLSATNAFSGEELFRLEFRTIPFTSPKGKVYELPEMMVEELREAMDGPAVSEIINKYRKLPTLKEVYNTTDFRDVCILVTGKEISQYTVRNNM